MQLVLTTLNNLFGTKEKNNPDICKRLRDIGLHTLAETKKPFRLVLVIGTEECRIAVKVAQQARTKQMLEWRSKQANEKALKRIEKIRFKKNVKKIRSLESVFKAKKTKKTKKRRK